MLLSKSFTHCQEENYHISVNLKTCELGFQFSDILVLASKDMVQRSCYSGCETRGTGTDEYSEREFETIFNLLESVPQYDDEMRRQLSTDKKLF